MLERHWFQWLPWHCSGTLEPPVNIEALQNVILEQQQAQGLNHGAMIVP